MIDVSGWRKRQIALDIKAENARELGLNYEPDKREHMTDKEALKLALEALCSAVEPKKGKVYAREFEPIDCFAMHQQAIAAIKEALAEQEPVACNHEWVDDTKTKPAWRCAKCGIEYTKEKNT